MDGTKGESEGGEAGGGGRVVWVCGCCKMLNDSYLTKILTILISLFFSIYI